MKPSEDEEHSSLSLSSSSRSELVICEDSEPERLARLSQKTKPSNSSLRILNSNCELNLNPSSSSNLIKHNQNHIKLASNLTFKTKSSYFQQPSIPTHDIKVGSSASILNPSNTTRAEESSTASLDKQGLPENLTKSTNTSSILIDVNTEKRGSNSIQVETDSSIEFGKSSVSRFIDRQSSKGSRSSSPKTRHRSVYVKSDNNSPSSNSSSDESVDIPYHTLTRLNSCPACSDVWKTYKAPRSKLTHIKKCAKTNLIRSKDIITRVQKILDHQIQNGTEASSLLDLHLQDKNVQLNILEKDPQVQKSLKNDLRYKPPQQCRSHQLNSSTSGPIHHSVEKQSIGVLKSSIRSGTHDLSDSGNLQSSRADRDKVDHASASLVSKAEVDLATLSPPEIIHRSSILAQARSRSRTRNSLISSDGKTPYTLWDAAGGHDGFDFQRSHQEHNESQDEAVSNGYQSSSVEATPCEPKASSSRPEVFENDDIFHQNLNSSNDRKEDCKIERTPSFENWTRNELKNENERLGFEDASDVSSSVLLERAKEAWRETALEVLRLQERNHHQFSLQDQSCSDEDGSDEMGIDEGLNTDPKQIEGYMEAGRFDEPGGSSPRSSQMVGTKANYQLTASNTYISGTGGGYRSDKSNLSRPASDVDVDENDSVLRGELEWIPPKNVMPDYSSYSKSALEVEYFSLHSLQEDQKACSEISSPPAALPKTKPAILARVIKLWETIYKLEPTLVEEGSSEVLSLRKQKKMIAPKKKKLTFEEIDELLGRVCVEDERLYLEILRYEPFKLSVFENKVAEACRIEHAKPISSLILSKWLDWQAISYYTLDPTVSRKRH